jgi:hypothetical protein
MVNEFPTIGAELMSEGAECLLGPCTFSSARGMIAEHQQPMPKRASSRSLIVTGRATLPSSTRSLRLSGLAMIPPVPRECHDALRIECSPIAFFVSCPEPFLERLDHRVIYAAAYKFPRPLGRTAVPRERSGGAAVDPGFFEAVPQSLFARHMLTGVCTPAFCHSAMIVGQLAKLLGLLGVVMQHLAAVSLREAVRE